MKINPFPILTTLCQNLFEPFIGFYKQRCSSRTNVESKEFTIEPFLCLGRVAQGTE